MKDYNDYMVVAILVCVIILLMNASTVFGQNDNNLMEVFVSIPNNEQTDTKIAYHSLSALTDSDDVVECLATFNDIKPDVVVHNITKYIEQYIMTIEFAGYKYTAGEDVVYKTVYFNKYGYIIPYECAVAQLQGNETNVLRDDEYQRVYHYDIKD